MSATPSIPFLAHYITLQFSPAPPRASLALMIWENHQLWKTVPWQAGTQPCWRRGTTHCLPHPHQVLMAVETEVEGGGQGAVTRALHRAGTRKVRRKRWHSDMSATCYCILPFGHQAILSSTLLHGPMTPTLGRGVNATRTKLQSIMWQVVCDQLLKGTTMIAAQCPL
jgi:hypothetical protein